MFFHCLLSFIQIVLNSLQRYKPCLHITEIPSNYLNRSNNTTAASNGGTLVNIEDFPTMTFEFPETSFIAVTAYQSEEVSSFLIFFLLSYNCDVRDRGAARYPAKFQVRAGFYDTVIISLSYQKMINMALTSATLLHKFCRVSRCAYEKSFKKSDGLFRGLEARKRVLFPININFLNESFLLQITQLKIDNNPFAKGFRDPTPAEIERFVLHTSLK